MFNDGEICTFDTHGGDSTYNNRSGKNIRIVRKLSENEVDIFDVGTMYEVEFSDGIKIDAFEDELTKV